MSAASWSAAARAGRRPVDDQHRHRRRRRRPPRRSRRWRAPAPSWCASRSTATRRRRRCRRSASGCSPRGVTVPLIGDFHYIGHTLLTDHPACAEALDKYRINPGNVGFGEKRDRQFATLIELALRYGKPVRIGVNWGSLDQALLTRLMDENAALPDPRSASRGHARGDRPVGAPLRRGGGEASACRANRIILSAKVSPGPGSDRRLCRARAPLRPRAPSRPHRGRHGLEGHRRLVGRARRSCCSRASATPSASR